MSFIGFFVYSRTGCVVLKILMWYFCIGLGKTLFFKETVDIFCIIFAPKIYIVVVIEIAFLGRFQLVSTTYVLLKKFEK